MQCLAVITSILSTIRQARQGGGLFDFTWLDWVEEDLNFVKSGSNINFEIYVKESMRILHLISKLVGFGPSGRIPAFGEAEFDHQILNFCNKLEVKL